MIWYQKRNTARREVLASETGKHAILKRTASNRWALYVSNALFGGRHHDCPTGHVPVEIFASKPAALEALRTRGDAAGRRDMDWTESLVRLDACSEAVLWARQHASLEAAWAACENPNWMLWLHARSEQPDPEAYAGLARMWVAATAVWVAATAAWAAAEAAAAAMDAAAARRAQCADIRAALQCPILKGDET